MTQDQSCPLCGSNKTQSYYSNENSSYLQCQNCELVFLAKRFHLNNIDEKARYDLHQNNPNDAGYRRFLSTIFDAVEQHLNPHAKGLDFGCGPGPTLSLIFAEKGYSMDLFDKFYADDPSIFGKQYDFITATEVAEHLQEPGQELSRLYGMLKPGGVLAIMTSMLTKEIDFATWHYKNDPTHICFFNQSSVQYLAKKWGANVEFIGSDIGLFFK